MMFRSAALVLEHFDDLPLADGLMPEPDRPEVPVKPIGYLSPEEAERKVADACEKTRVECEARAEAVLNAALADQSRKFEEQLEASRREWTEVQAERLTVQVVSASEVLETKIAAAAARALRPFVIEKVREQAVAEMRSALAKMLASSTHPTIQVSGPQDLLDALADAMSDTALSLSLHPDASCELRVVADETVLETQMQEWVSRLAAPSGATS